MNFSSIDTAVGLIVMVATVTALLLSVRSTTKKNQAKIQDDLAQRYNEGIQEGERRMEPKLGRLQAEVDLRTSERDQARTDLGNARNEHRDRRGHE